MFLNFSSQKPKSDISGPRFRDLYFCSNLCNKANLRGLISNMTKLFWISSPKTPKLEFWFQVHRFVFKGVNYKYDNGFFLNSSPETYKKNFLVLNLNIFKVLGIFLIAKYCEKVKILKFGTKGALFEYFRTSILNNYYCIWNQRY